MSKARIETNPFLLLLTTNWIVYCDFYTMDHILTHLYLSNDIVIFLSNTNLIRAIIFSRIILLRGKSELLSAHFIILVIMSKVEV